MRIIYYTTGIISLALALAGVVLPLLPTTPFLLLSAFCFAKSSSKLHDWLLQRPYLGAVIKDWRKNGSISRKNKFFALVAISLTVFISFVYELPPVLLAIQILVLGIVSMFILTRPHERERGSI